MVVIGKGGRTTTLRNTKISFGIHSMFIIVFIMEQVGPIVE